MDPNSNIDPTNELSEEQRKLYQKLREQIDPEQFERDFLATTEWVPVEEVVERLVADLCEIRGLFSASA